ncbi:hypothetical protein AAGF08_19700, partial [Algoriphagus sp. SE2]|uniref:hypothetical protein n=1 Tax=Algoriphagus sp. SE2 TaxID=3141536 RepID=UPI0031CD9B09
NTGNIVANNTLITNHIAADGDLDATNEIQALLTAPSQPGQIGITNGNSITINVDDADADPTNEIQLLIPGNTQPGVIGITGGNTTTLNVNDADADPTNEIELPTGGNNGQVLSTDGNGNYTWVDNSSASSSPIKAFGKVNADGTPAKIFGASIGQRVQPGLYAIQFTTPRSNGDYIIQLTNIQGKTMTYGLQDANGFTVLILGNNGKAEDTEFMFTVIDL